jgi:hypothetical protein
MKRILPLICCITAVHSMAQVTLPMGYLKPPMKTVQNGRFANALVTSSDSTHWPSEWFPTIKNTATFESQKAQFLQNNVISYNDSLSNISLYTEIASDYIGPVRVSAGITLAYPKTDTNTVQQQQVNRQKFLQRFSTGGGTLAFNFTLPVFTYNSQIFGITMSTGPRFSLEPPSFGVATGKFSDNTALGTDLQAELRGIKEVFKFTGALRLGYVAGNSAFYDALLLTGDNRKAFWLNNYNIGVTIKDIFTLSYTKFWGSHNIADKLTGYLTFTVSPNFK